MFITFYMVHSPTFQCIHTLVVDLKPIAQDPDLDPEQVSLIVKKMETLKAKKEDLEMSELALRFEKIDNIEQVSLLQSYQGDCFMYVHKFGIFFLNSHTNSGLA
jgi:hypothetical protein